MAKNPSRRRNRRAKDSILNYFVLISNHRKKSARQMAYDLFYGYPRDYLALPPHSCGPIEKGDSSRPWPRGRKIYLHRDQLARNGRRQFGEFGKSLFPAWGRVRMGVGEYHHPGSPGEQAPGRTGNQLPRTRRQRLGCSRLLQP